MTLNNLILWLHPWKFLPGLLWPGGAVPDRVQSMGQIKQTVCKHMIDVLLWLFYIDKSWMQHPTKKQLNSHLPPIMKTIQVRWTRNVGHCWRNRDELISDKLLWTSSHGWAKAGWPARTYVQQLCSDTGCSMKTCRKQWTIERDGEKGSGISMLMAQHDDDDDIAILETI